MRASVRAAPVTVRSQPLLGQAPRHGVAEIPSVEAVGFVRLPARLIRSAVGDFPVQPLHVIAMLDEPLREVIQQGGVAGRQRLIPSLIRAIKENRASRGEQGCGVPKQTQRRRPADQKVFADPQWDGGAGQLTVHSGGETPPLEELVQAPEGAHASPLAEHSAAADRDAAQAGATLERTVTYRNHAVRDAHTR